jgi:hypothetical protein
MHRPFARPFALVTSLVLALGLASCGRDTTDNTAGPDNTATQTAAPTTVTAVELGRGVDTDKRVTERVEQFRPNDTIYASVITSGTAPATLRTRWLFQDGQVVEETTQSISPQGTAATEFHISKPDGFPAGTYTVEVALDGNVVQTKQFTVE